MIVYYAMGGGLGHLNRARKVLSKLNLTGPIKIITACKYANLIFNEEHIFQVQGNAGHYLTGSLDETHNIMTQASHFITDCFPFGILAELDFNYLNKDATRIHITRAMDWRKYRDKIKIFNKIYCHTYYVEEIEKEHFSDLNRLSSKIDYLEIDFSPKERLRMSSRNYSLIVHSGPEEEIIQLCEYAIEITKLKNIQSDFFLISPLRVASLPSRIKQVNCYPASSYFH